MLDSMPVEAVLIDRDGVIVAVNAHWDRFARANGYPAGAFGLGTNYLHTCLGSGGEPAVEGRIVAAGLRDLLCGRVAEFSTVYPCHAPTERRWFRLIAAATADASGAVVLHFNITPEMLAEERLVADRITVERRLARIEAALRFGARAETGLLVGSSDTTAAAVDDGGDAGPSTLPARYRAMLHTLMGAHIYRRQQSIRDDAWAIAKEMAATGADAAAVARLHAGALTALQAGTTPEKATRIALEARLAFIAVLGHLADHYRALVAER